MPLTHSGDDFSIRTHYLAITRVGPEGSGMFLRVLAGRWQGFAGRNGLKNDWLTSLTCLVSIFRPRFILNLFWVVISFILGKVSVLFHNLRDKELHDIFLINYLWTSWNAVKCTNKKTLPINTKLTSNVNIICGQLRNEHNKFQIYIIFII